MSRIDALCRRYAGHVALPWETGLSGVQRVWFAVYNKEDERRLRRRVEEFEIATREAGHGWILVDLTNAFAEWMAAHPKREEYFKEPELLTGPPLRPFHEATVERIRSAFAGPDVGADAVVALLGVGSLFGFTSVSKVVKDVQDHIPGRLLVFFPGEHDPDNNVYRLLDARDGWNYMAVPIKANDPYES